MTGPRTIFLAGIGNSEPEHWQSYWYRSMPAALWVEHLDWDRPDCAVWLRDLDALLTSTPGPKRIIAHSLGCLLFAEWLRLAREATGAADHTAKNNRILSEINCALLVAPPDPQAAAFPPSARGFASPFVWNGPLPWPVYLVASRNDPYAGFDYAERLARHWGVRLVDAGKLGHINLKSDLRDWPAGRAILAELEGAAK